METERLVRAEGHIWQTWAALKIAQIQIFSVRLFGVMTKTSVSSDKNVHLLTQEFSKLFKTILPVNTVLTLSELHFQVWLYFSR